MKTLIRLLKLIRGFIPEQLPQGMTHFETWASDIIEIYGYPNNESTRFTLATMIFHTGQTKKVSEGAYRSKFHFNMLLKGAVARQIAGEKFAEYRNKKELAEKAALEAATNEPQQPAV